MDHPPTLLRRPSGWTVGAVSLVLTAIGAVGCSARGDESAASSRQSIAGGTVDVSHQDVFFLISHQGQSAALCTATLIAPNLLLTARHCVSPNGSETDHVLCGDALLGDPFPPSAFFATNDAQPRENSTYFGASDVRVPQAGGDTCGYDIALIILKQNVPSIVSTPAVPRIDRDALPGEPYTAVGYGEMANGQPSGSRMQLAGLSIACEPGTCGEGVESTEFRGETGICSGDSGGPALDANGKVVGVVSRGGPDCSEPVYGSVAAWRDFIVDTAQDAATLGGYDPPFWVTSGSSDPASPVLVGAAGAPPEPNNGVEGETCTSTGDCGDGLVCYAKRTGTSGLCTTTCTATADCSSGHVCQTVGSVSVCATPALPVDDEGGCAVSATGSGRTSWVALLGALGVGLAWARRRRR